MSYVCIVHTHVCINVCTCTWAYRCLRSKRSSCYLEHVVRTGSDVRSVLRAFRAIARRFKQKLKHHQLLAKMKRR